MSRPSVLSPNDLADRTLRHFWTHGFDTVGMADMLREIGTSRHSFYAAFGSKRAAYLACFRRYDADVVAPAFAIVEAERSIASIATYFETQIALAEQIGLPGPGCFVANAAADCAADDAEVKARIAAHNTRLAEGFAKALASAGHPTPEAAGLHSVIFAQGLWTYSRTVTEAAPLRRAVQMHLKTLKEVC